MSYKSYVLCLWRQFFADNNIPLSLSLSLFLSLILLSVSSVCEKHTYSVCPSIAVMHIDLH